MKLTDIRIKFIGTFLKFQLSLNMHVLIKPTFFIQHVYVIKHDHCDE